MNRLKKTFVFVALSLCTPVLYAQNCNLSDLSPKGLEHLKNANTYINMILQGTEKQAVAEYEAILQTDSLWCPDLYFKLGMLCEYTAQQKDICYYDKSILYYKKYNLLMPSDSVTDKIRQLEIIKKGLTHSLGPDAIKQGIKNEMVLIEGMLNEDTTGCIHSFYIGKYELTQKQWQSVMDGNPSHFRLPNNPVEQICGQYELFFKELNRLTGSNYRLPTSSEWFYSARGGKKMENYDYSGGFAENKVAWFSSNSGDCTHEVGEKEPNSLGLYDMSGNVSELVYVDDLKEQPKTTFDGMGRPRADFKRVINGSVIPVGGNYRSLPYSINANKRQYDDMDYIVGQGESVYVIEKRKNQDGFYQDYRVERIISSHIGIRLVQDIDIKEMSTEEQQWDTWIQQKAERLQKEIEKEQRIQERKNLWKNGSRHYYGDKLYRAQRGLRFDYKFQANRTSEKEDVFVNKFFRHFMFGLDFRIPIGAFFYAEPQIKVGIESDWNLVSQQDGFVNQLETCFDNIQTIPVEIPLMIGGIYRFGDDDIFAVRGYTGGEFCPTIRTKNATIISNSKSYFAVLFGLGFDLEYLSLDFYYRKPLSNASSLSASGYTASLGFLF